MVIPAEGYQIVRIVVATVGSLYDVVGLEPVSASTSVDLTLSLVAVEDERADSGWDRFSEVGDADGAVVFSADDDPDFASAQDIGERVGPDSRP